MQAHSLTLNPSQIQEALDETTLENLRPLTAAASVVFCVFTVFNWFELPDHARNPVVIHDVFLVSLFALIYRLLVRDRLPARMGSRLTALVALLVGSNVLLTYGLVGEGFYTNYLVIISLALGATLLCHKWLLSTQLLLFCAWAVTNWWTDYSPYESLHFSFTLIAAGLVSAGVATARIRTYTRMHTLRLNEEHRRHQLAEALQASEGQRSELSKAEERLRALLKDVDAIVWEADSDWHFRFVSDFAEEVLGYPLEEWTGQADFWRSVAHREDLRSADLPHDWLDHESEHFMFETRATDHQGDDVWLRVILRPFPDESEAGVGLRGIMLDITQIKHAHEVETRGLEEQVRQLQRLDALGRLAGGVAHDFNNLLTGILGCADMLRQSPDLADGDEESVQLIIDSAKSGAELTQQLLGFARKGKYRNTTISLKETIQEVTSLLDRTFAKNIRIEFTPCEEATTTLGDPDQLQQVMLNLAINARDAMPNGGTLRFSIRRSVVAHEWADGAGQLAPGDYICLHIEDTGEGISPTDLERVFEPFFTTKQKGQGTGMGLSMAYGIIRNHQGAIALESRLTGGTRAVVYLPFVPVEAKDELITGKLTRLSDLTVSGSVLLVDDEPLVARVSEKMLLKLGFKTSTAADGLEAVAKLQEMEDHPAFVLLDMRMPRMAGPECFAKLRALAPSLPIILTTGYANDDKAQRLCAEPLTGLLYKPYNLTKMTDVINALLLQAQQATQEQH